MSHGMMHILVFFSEKSTLVITERLIEAHFVTLSLCWARFPPILIKNNERISAQKMLHSIKIFIIKLTIDDWLQFYFQIVIFIHLSIWVSCWSSLIVYRFFKLQTNLEENLPELELRSIPIDGPILREWIHPDIAFFQMTAPIDVTGRWWMLF